jgi:hypothetical protein
VLDSGCTNHMTGEIEMFISFEKNDCPNDTITFCDNSEGKVLGHGQIAITAIILFQRFCLLNHWTTICYPSHNFMR